MYPSLLPLIFFSIAAAFTPGPNNIVGSYSGFNFGIKKSLPLILGVTFGYTTLITLLAAGLNVIFNTYPILKTIIKIVGSLFLIYLAYKISFSKNTSGDAKKNPVKFIETFFFQFINPKSVIVAIIVISTYVEGGQNFWLYSFWVIGVALFFAIFSIIFWTLIGKFLRKFATNEKFIKRFNYVMSLLLVSCIATFYL